MAAPNRASSYVPFIDNRPHIVSAMIRARRLLRTLALAATLGFASSVAAHGGSPAPNIAAIAASATAPQGPALWKVSDGDTTIYLFGTVHALPPTIDWYDGEIGEALAASQELVTEIPRGAVEDPAAQQMIGMRAVLPAGQSMRDFLKPAERATYEKAMAKLDLPVDSFDRFEPWFAGMTLSVLPLLKRGYASESGVEKVIETKSAPTVQRDALETLDQQIDMFDQLPMKSQVAFLVSTAENIDSVVPNMDAMVTEWIDGDADELARIMNKGLTDKTLADTLLYSRNRKWAEWIATRMDKPGTVFLAVGAGHLAGQKSVQQMLRKHGLTVVRVQ